METCLYPHILIQILSFGVLVSMQGMPGSDEGCSLDEKTERLQVAFVCDQTYTNIDSIQVIAKKIPAIMASLNNIHKDTEFAITTHANYEDYALTPRPRRRKKRQDGPDAEWADDNSPHISPLHKDPEGCYSVAQTFTTDQKMVSDAAANIQEKGSLSSPLRPFKEENSIPAMAMTLADLTLGWVAQDIDPQGRNVHRFLILLTDQFSIFKLPNPGNRRPYRGDGSDLCSKNLPATRDQAAATLRKHEAMVIGVYVKLEDKSFDMYNQYFQHYNIPHEARRFRNAVDVNSNIVEFITSSVKKHLACSFEDPPAYNTLGL